MKLFPSEVAPPENDPEVAGVLVQKVRFERARQFGNCLMGWELWKRLELDRFQCARLDREPAEVAWSRVAAVLVVNRLCAPAANWR